MGQVTDAPSPRFLLDSNICIYLLDGSDLERAMRVADKLAHYDPAEVTLSAVTVAEVFVGIREQEAMDAAASFFDQFTILPFDEECAKTYAGIPFKRASFDRLIAATALHHELTIITNNEKDFSNVPGLKVENWTS